MINVQGDGYANHHDMIISVYIYWNHHTVPIKGIYYVDKMFKNIILKNILSTFKMNSIEMKME